MSATGSATKIRGVQYSVSHHIRAFHPISRPIGYIHPSNKIHWVKCRHTSNSAMDSKYLLPSFVCGCSFSQETPNN